MDGIDISLVGCLRTGNGDGVGYGDAGGDGGYYRAFNRVMDVDTDPYAGPFKSFNDFGDGDGTCNTTILLCVDPSNLLCAAVNALIRFK